MKELIEWLQTIEERAFLLYEFAAEAFAGDKALKGLLLHLAEEERLHFELLRRAGAYLKDTPTAPAIISVDDIKKTIEKPFIECMEKAKAGKLSKDELLGYITLIEYSELNHVFLYLIDSLKHRSPIFSGVTENIELHKDCLKRYLLTQPNTGALIGRIERMPVTNREAILVVDDKPANVNLLKAILEPIGRVEGACDGLDALKKVVLRRYSAVVTDVEMPRMSGTEFYSKATKMLPRLKHKFVFYTGASSAAEFEFFRANNLKYIIKPAPINEIRKTVSETISAESRSAQPA
ncbi:MAG: response regulator [Deltaproteobacteria bacterium]|nr:response regulator [Deltaproteobacteria bacterium]